MKNTIIPKPNNFYDCPICGQKCCKETTPRALGLSLKNITQRLCQVFSCYNPLPNEPLHYYSHVVEESSPDKIIFQEFEIDLGNKSVIFGVNYNNQKSYIKTSQNLKSLEVPFIIVPDFSNLVSLGKKIRTVIVFT